MPKRKLQLDRIYNMDCFEGMKMIPANSVNLIVTDPPYNMQYDGGGGSVNRIKKMKKSLDTLGTLRDGYDIRKFSEEVIRLQGKDICVYFWCNKKQIPEYMAIYVGELKCKFDIICWHKRNALPTYSNKYLSDTEYCLYFHKGKGKTHPKGYEDAKTYFVGMINHADKKIYNHPTIKPLEYIRTLIRNSSNENDVILDPFMGSGTTAIACLKENRRYIGFEINEEYYDISQKRIENEKKIQLSQ